MQAGLQIRLECPNVPWSTAYTCMVHIWYLQVCDIHTCRSHTHTSTHTCQCKPPHNTCHTHIHTHTHTHTHTRTHPEASSVPSGEKEQQWTGAEWEESTPFNFMSTFPEKRGSCEDHMGSHEDITWDHMRTSHGITWDHMRDVTSQALTLLHRHIPQLQDVVVARGDHHVAVPLFSLGRRHLDRVHTQVVGHVLPDHAPSEGIR